MEYMALEIWWYINPYNNVPKLHILQSGQSPLLAFPRPFSKNESLPVRETKENKVKRALLRSTKS